MIARPTKHGVQLQRKVVSLCSDVALNLRANEGYADGCDACWKDKGYEGEPPCNIKKSQ